MKEHGLTLWQYAQTLAFGLAFYALLYIMFSL